VTSLLASTEAPPSAATLDAVDRVLVAAEVILALAALGGAAGLISGLLDLGDSVKDLPWQSPVVAGIALGILNGVFPFAVVFAMKRRSRWAPVGHVAVGIVLMTWIGVQVGYIGLNSPLQIIYAAYGVLLAGLGVWNVHARHNRMIP
jgi:hypothetical protein